MSTPLNKTNRTNRFIEGIALQLLENHFNGDRNLLPAVTKMLLHDGILSALHNAGILKRIVFHGGTAMQRIYGNIRISEDLDFTCRQKPTDMASFVSLTEHLEEVVRDILRSNYGVADENITIHSPRYRPVTGDDDIFGTRTWRISVETHYHLCQQVIKIDVDGRAAMTCVEKLFIPLALPLQIPPMNILVESEAELLVNKMLALTTRGRLQMRDIFDLEFLAGTLHVRLDEVLLAAKCAARPAMTVAQREQATERITQLQAADAVLRGRFMEELGRFLPRPARDILSDGVVTGMCHRAAQGIERCLGCLAVAEG
jgi:predicted nucleotidyltransferase component of viral defense system